MQLADIDILAGVRYHTAYFYDTFYNHTRQLGVIPVDLNGRCVVAEEVGNRHCPLKWKCTNECRTGCSLVVK